MTVLLLGVLLLVACLAYVFHGLLILFAGILFGIFLAELIAQRQTSLPPGLVLAAQLLFGMLAGFTDLLLTTPLTAVLSVIITEFYVRGQLGEEPP